LHDDEQLNSNIYAGYKGYAYDKNQKTFVPKDANEEAVNGKRYFVSLMSESLIKKNVFFGFRKRTRVSRLANRLPYRPLINPIFHIIIILSSLLIKRLL
jgi:hypothetical protein